MSVGSVSGDEFLKGKYSLNAIELKWEYMGGCGMTRFTGVDVQVDAGRD